MRLDASVFALWGIAAALGALVWYKKGPEGVRAGLKSAWQLAAVMVRIAPFALFAAMMLAQVIPNQIIASYIGPETGLQGMALASVAGGFLPSGPFLSFPIALTLYHTGAGLPQLIAFITGWSVYALFRVMVWEIPMMGPRFVIIRLGASLILPMVGGILSALLFQMF